MLRRQILGLAMTFIFLPTNTPIWDVALGGDANPVRATVLLLTGIGFIAGLLFLAVPPKTEATTTENLPTEEE
jgi:hypothetical protein